MAHRSKKTDAHTRHRTSPESRRLEATSFTIKSELYFNPEAQSQKEYLITEKTFTAELFSWLLRTPLGIIVFIVSGGFSLIMVLFCVWRTCHAPDNQDGVVRDYSEKIRNNETILASSPPKASQQRQTSNKLETCTPKEFNVKEKRGSRILSKKGYSSDDVALPM